MSSPQAPELAVGSVVSRRYRIDEQVGAGGFATVYRARHLQLDTDVALKVLRLGTDPTRRERELERFLDEARILARLRHQSIVAVMDAGVEATPDGGGTPWMVLEWCDGRTLASELASRGGTPMLPLDAWEILRPIAQAVGVAHAAGVVHRDLKPANVMLVDTPAGVQPRVLDFGIAKVFERAPDPSIATQGTLLGSSAYAAPEQMVGSATGPFTDIHALGLLYVEMVSGKSPYDGTGYGAVSMERPTPLALGVDVGNVEPVIARATALEPGQRWQDTRAFVSAMDAAVGSIPPRAIVRVGDRATTSRGAPRRSHAAAPRTAVAALALAGVVAGAIAGEAGSEIGLGLGVGAGAGLLVALALLRTGRPRSAAPRRPPTASDPG
jgi:serine/threonine-protein kinase